MLSEIASRAAHAICDLFGTMDHYEAEMAACIDRELSPPDILRASHGAGWHKVETDPPATESTVLVWSESRGAIAAVYRQWRQFSSVPGQWNVADATHWMPLPEGPK